MGSEFLDGPRLINAFLGNGLPHGGGVTVLVVVVVLTDFVEEEHQTSVRSDLGQVGESTSPETEDTVLLDSLAGTIPETVEFNIDIRAEGLLVLGLHLLTETAEKFDFVFDASGRTLNQQPALLVYPEYSDLTERVIIELNRPAAGKNTTQKPQEKK